MDPHNVADAANLHHYNDNVSGYLSIKDIR